MALFFLFDAYLTLFWTPAFEQVWNVQTGIAQKFPNQLFSGLVHSKGLLNPLKEHLTKSHRHFLKLLARLNPVWLVSTPLCTGSQERHIQGHMDSQKWKSI